MKRRDRAHLIDQGWQVPGCYKKQSSSARDKQQCPKSLKQRLVLATARPLRFSPWLLRGALANIDG